MRVPYNRFLELLNLLDPITELYTAQEIIEVLEVTYNFDLVIAQSSSDYECTLDSLDYIKKLLKNVDEVN